MLNILSQAWQKDTTVGGGEGKGGVGVGRGGGEGGREKIDKLAEL